MTKSAAMALKWRMLLFYDRLTLWLYEQKYTQIIYHILSVLLLSQALTLYTSMRKFCILLPIYKCMHERVGIFVFICKYVSEYTFIHL